MFDQGQVCLFKFYDCDGWVIYCLSFFKIILFGVCIGWIIVECYQEEICCLQIFIIYLVCIVIQMGVVVYLENGGYDCYLCYICQEYWKNMIVYQLVVQQYFLEGMQMIWFKGGFIFWVSLLVKVNIKEFYVWVLEQGISIVLGLIFSNIEQFNNCLWLICGIFWNCEVEWVIMIFGMFVGQFCQEGFIVV